MANEDERARARQGETADAKGKEGRAADPLKDGLKAVASASRQVNAALSPDDPDRTMLVQRQGRPGAASLHEALRAAEAALEPGQKVDAAAPTLAHRGAVKPTPGAAKTQLVRGAQRPVRSDFHQDPVVGWLVIIGGPGLGSFRPIFEGNNTIGRAAGQRIPIDFGDDAISSEEQAFLRYDSVDRQFLLVPNLAKTNVISVNEAKPTSAVKLAAMDVITMGRTQLVFVPFCGDDFDWSDLAALKE